MRKKLRAVSLKLRPVFGFWNSGGKFSVFKAALCLLFGFYGVLFSVSQDTAGAEGMSRSSIPEELLRPQRGESPRYPVDTVIGPLGRGDAAEDAYLFARKVSAALTAGNKNDSSLSGMNSVSLEAFLSELGEISPRVYRLGSGREEPDGAVSFLVRFLGRERAITGELYIRPQGFEPPEDSPEPALTRTPEAAADEPADEAEPAVEEAAVEAAPAEETAAELAAAPAEELLPLEETAEAEDQPEEGAELPAGPRIPQVPVVWIFEDLILEEARERETEAPDAAYDFPPYERFF
jgi:hypothetical protein